MPELFATANKSRTLARLRVVAIVTSILAVAAIVWCLPVDQMAVRFADWAARLGPEGILVYVGGFVALTICCLPVWPMPFLAGGLFGPFWGTVITSASGVMAAAITFWIARLLGRTSCRHVLERSPRMRALESTVESADWKIVAAVRLSQFLPFGMQNYAFGLTSIRFRTFLLTTWLATLPAAALQVYLGHLGFTSVQAWQGSVLAGWQTWTMRLGGLAVIGAAAAYVAHLAHAVFRRSVQQQLKREIQAEQKDDAAQNRRHVGTWALIAVATLSVALAIGAYAYRDAIQHNFEKPPAAPDIHKDADRSRPPSHYQRSAAVDSEAPAPQT